LVIDASSKIVSVAIGTFFALPAKPNALKTSLPGCATRDDGAGHAVVVDLAGEDRVDVAQSFARNADALVRGRGRLIVCARRGPAG